ncbi:hypothetical protein HMPREF0578_0259 [Mobiluncus mulieris 28-1]|uniref:VG15 protein n=2 Tax=Mobiluncus mulieris TaxID=2052 RepID=UPI0001BE7D52|nr:hypothetical protein [Mobiluncus mulieris]EEZ90353.1 hypothetical protein HMPREF0578_0259 [Mobiluncus mulieris 28-1]MCU9970145.1 hypothetical protein [Mobiluncus mulieris]MCU9993631.1 hypothetical protein [Mobiluncus mulieris]NMW61965.1 hypothetical protein [Mobiluncus mulieris]NMW89899.1 hypothetical protein [Mobiluncus mulieris]
MASAAQVRLFQRGLETLEKAMLADLKQVWDAITGAEPDTVSRLVQELLPELIDRYGVMAESMAADWYEELTGQQAFIPDAYANEAYRASTRWALSPLFAGEHGADSLDAAFDRLSGSLVRHMRQYARSTVNESVRRSGGKVSYARMVMGATTCDFCLMLASRGPVYGSSETAGGEGNKYHDHCDCIPVPVVGRWVVDSSTQRGYRWEGQSPGYDFEELYATEYKPYWRENDTIHDVLARRRQAKARLRETEKRQTRKASVDGTLQREKWNAYRGFVEDLAKQRGIKIDGKQYRLPPKTWAEPPSDWPEDLPALRAKEWNHILYGDQRGGGHSSGYGWIHDRTEFDAEWTSENITSKLCEFLRNIDFQNVRISELFTMSKDGVKYAIGVARKRGRIRVTTFYRLED